MTQDANQGGKRTFKIMAAGIAAFAAFLAVVVFFTVDLSYKHFDYPKAEMRYKASGLPWTADQLTFKKVPEGENGFDDLVKLLDEQSQLEKLQVPVIKSLMTPSDYSVVKEYLDSRNSLLDKAQGVSKLDVEWIKDWDSGASVLLPELAGVKSLVKDLCLRAEYRSARRDVDGAAADLRTAVGLKEQVSAGPTLINGLVEIACRSIVLRGLQRCASFHLNDANALEKLLSSVSPLSTPPDMSYHLRGEAFMSITTLRNFKWQYIFNSGLEDYVAPDPKTLRRDGEITGIAARSFAVPLLEAWADAAEEIKTKGNTPQTMMAAAKSLEKSSENAKGVSATLMQVLFPVFSQAGTAYAKSEADYLAAEGAMRMAIARAKGRPSAEVKLAVDPFGSGSLQSDVSKSRIKVWSLGLNRKDDGGLSNDEAKALRQTTGSAASSPPGLSGSAGSKQDDVDLVFELPYKRYLN